MGPGRIGTALAMLLLLAPMAVRAASFDTIVIDDNMGGAKGNGDYAVGQGASRQEAERIAMSNCTLGRQQGLQDQDHLPAVRRLCILGSYQWHWSRANHGPGIGHSPGDMS